MKVIKAAFEEHGLDVPRATVTTHSTYALSVLVANGLFLAMHPSAMLTTPNEHPQLTAVDVRLRKTRGLIGLITLKSRSPSPVAKLFLRARRSRQDDTSRRLIGAKFALIRASQRRCGDGLRCLAGGTCVQLIGHIYSGACPSGGSMATASFHLRKGRCRKDDAVRELARTLPEWCFAAPPQTFSSPKSALPWSASAGGAIPRQGAGRGVHCCRFHGHLE